MYFNYRTVVYALFCLVLSLRLQAQDEQYYIYIQSEKGQPFYVKHNGKVLSSTERGYIIIPRLEAGTTPLTIGFAKDEGPEQRFYVRVAGKDQGYLIKKKSDSYTLYNLQTFRELKADEENSGSDPVAATEEVPVPATDADSAARKEMLGNMQKELEDKFRDKATVTGPAPAAKPAASGNPFASALDKVVKEGPPPAEPEETIPVTAETPPKKSGKKKEDKGALSPEEQDLLNEVMAEENRKAASEAAATEEEPLKKPRKQRKKKEGDPDFIEFMDNGAAPAAATVPAAAPAITTDLPAAAPMETEKPSKKKRKRVVFDETEHPNNIINDSSGYAVYAAPEKTSERKKKKADAESYQEESAPAVKMINSDCANVMDDEGFRKLLRKFVAAKNEDGMLDVFRRQTRNYCLETQHIRTLAQLLNSDETRYRLLDMAYPKTADSEKFSSLESLLTENYYRGRFRALINK